MPPGRAFVALAGPHAVAVVDLQRKRWWRGASIAVHSELAGDGHSVAVTMGETQGRVFCSIPQTERSSGSSTPVLPVSPVFLEQGKLLAVCNRFTNSIGFYEAATGRLVSKAPRPGNRSARYPALRADLFCGLSPARTTFYVGHVAAAIDVLEVSPPAAKEHFAAKRTELFGGMTLSRDGKFLFVQAILGHYQVLPTT